jgi:predicted glycogen debranching enzyme
MTETLASALPPALVVPIDPSRLDALLEKEWLLTNRLGAYASGTAVGCNARRYHALLVAATTPPVGRLTALSLLMEELVAEAGTFALAANEFPGAFAPRGFEQLAEFRNDVLPTFTYRCGGMELTKEIVLAETANAVAVRYTLRGGRAVLRVAPFVAMRDFHGLRKGHEAHRLSFSTGGAASPATGGEGGPAGAPVGIVIHDHAGTPHSLHITCPGAAFSPQPQWWYNFVYRIDIARGQDGTEDLYTPGTFSVKLEDGQSCQFTASLEGPTTIDFDATAARRRAALEELAASAGPGADEATRRLAVATDAFVVLRDSLADRPGQTILAGYHWFADWGRDAFISLPGLLLATRRYDAARRVFATFSRAISDGMVPNRFDDYGGAPHYNSIDASLWFILAADRYMEATGDNDFWQRTLMPACQRIVSAYHDGTLFDIRADADGLLAGGSRTTQLTWMDVALGQEVITPRHGKPVEVNALWYHAHRVLEKRCAAVDPSASRRYGHQADLIGPAFARAFWNEQAGCLYDCLTENWPADPSIRPNQILSLALPGCPLTAQQQASVLRVVTENLLTPYGLRTLAPNDGRYRRRYGGSWESRDRAYHQGTVWAWLIGPYIDALLNVEGDTSQTRHKARRLLSGFDAHLAEAGLGFVSEIFDADPPHTPRGCIAQAWSVAEVLRAKLRVRQ